MTFIVKMSDHVKDESIEMRIEAPSVFDAVDIASTLIDNPSETELIEAVPVFV